MLDSNINKLKSTILIVFSVLILTILYNKIDFILLKNALKESNKLLLILGFLMSCLLGVISGIKYSYFSRLFNISPAPSVLTAIKSYFIAGSFNIILPSKLGDFGKSYICSRIDNISYTKELYVFTIYEKISDLFALILITFLSYNLFHFFANCSINSIQQNCIDFQSNEFLFYLLIILFLVTFLLINPFLILNKLKSFFPDNINMMITFITDCKISSLLIYHCFTIAFWLVNLLQIEIFALSLKINLFSIAGILIISLTILCGLIPITFAGIGSREIILTLFLSPVFGTVKPLLLGTLFTSRYVIPALIGLIYIKEISLRSKTLNKI
tara:strand:+ start:1169 stop:2152 length:984 start_codon:yes stop_codon:yes gene_type:complete